jgi:hypothetical protein
MNIYYCYDKTDGRFLGSGITQVDDEKYSSTNIPCPNYDPRKEIPCWENEQWIIKDK